MAKRDLIREIQEKNSRASNRYLHGSMELYDLERSFKNLKSENEPLLALHIIGAAACIEVSVRETIRRLVDHGSPYLDRVERFKDHIRFDFLLTKALSTQQITFGDLVAHSLPISSVQHIASHLESLLNLDGLEKGLALHLGGIKQFVEPDEQELMGGVPPINDSESDSPFLILDPVRLLSEISAIFSARHIVAHEANFKASRQDVATYLESTRVFVNTLYELVEQALRPNKSRSSFGSSIEAMIEASKIADEVEGVTRKVDGILENKLFDYRRVQEEFRKSCAAFDAYVEAQCEFEIALYGPVNGNAMRNIEAGVRKNILQSRLNHVSSIENEIESWTRSLDQK